MKRILTLCLMLVLLPCLFACGGEHTPSHTFTGDLTGYRLIYPASADTEIGHAVMELMQALETATGVSLQADDDTIIPEIDKLETEKEILIGMTNREESEAYSTLPAKDFVITCKGEKLLLAATSTEAILDAISYFQANYIDATEKAVTLREGNAYTYTHSYPNIFIGGVSVSEFSILATGSALPYAEQWNEVLQDKIGKSLPIIADYAEATNGKIIELYIDPVEYPSMYTVELFDTFLTFGAPTETGMQRAIENFIEKTGIAAMDQETIEIEPGYSVTEAYSPDITSLENPQNIYLKGEVMGSFFQNELGEDVSFLFSLHANGALVGAYELECIITGDNIGAVRKYFPLDSGEAVVTIPSLAQPGTIQIQAKALDIDGKQVGSSIKVGAFVGAEDVDLAVEAPEDFREFWKQQMDLLYTVDPMDTTPPTAAEIANGVDPSNYFHLVKVTEADIPYFNEQSQRFQAYRNYNASSLKNIDVYEFYLKCPGKMPATGFISIPKDRSKKYGISITTNGYGIYRAYMPAGSNTISIGMNTHGLPNLCSEDVYYALRGKDFTQGGLNRYGQIVSDYDDPATAYFTYMLLRNMQALRFAMVYGADCWNGNINATGSSQGGFQTIAIAALATLTEDIKVQTASAIVPWMCDVGGKTLGRKTPSIGIYCRGLDYFDSANFATLITDTVMQVEGGFADDTCPPTGVLAFYNRLQCPKSLTFIQNRTHTEVPSKDTNYVAETVQSN